jgi:hypothetical protein
MWHVLKVLFACALAVMISVVVHVYLEAFRPDIAERPRFGISAAFGVAVLLFFYGVFVS